ncbi:MAG TPA: SMC family ATPase, partial [Thermodesulfobacteriota bacterium]|nr:SMC family ATPase [Thermodesulfobacteriota bacterium]
MVPLKLSLKNFLSYGENTQALDFRDFSIACLSGRNGHGKSALIDALTWALWGRCRVKNKDEVIKRGASEAQVELEFESEGNTYRILRSITKKKGTSQGTVDLQVLDEGEGSFKPLDQGAKTQNTIEKILKMDYNSFICSSFILQGMADEFTKRTPAERKEVLSRILELDEYETLTKKARDRAQEAGAAAAALEGEASRIEGEISQKEEHEKKLGQLRSEEASVSESIAGFEKMTGGLIAEFESLRAKLETLSRLGRERDESAAAHGKTAEELRVLRESIGRDREIVAREAEILKAFGEYEAARETERVLNEKLLRKSDLEKELGSLSASSEKEKSKIEQRAAELEARIAGNRKIIRGTEEIISRQKDIEAGYGRLRQAIESDASLNEKKAEAEAIRSGMSETERKIGEKRAELETKAKELAAKVRELESKASLSGRLTQELAVLRASIAGCEELSKKAEAVREELKRAGGEKQAAQARQSELEKRKAEEREKLHVLASAGEDKHCPLCESPLEEEARAALVEKLGAVIAGLDESIARTRSDVQALGEREESLRNEEAALDARVGRLPSLHRELGEKERSLSESEAASRTLEETKKLFDEASASVKDGSYRKEFEAVLAELAQKRAALGYDEERHNEIKKEVESLRRYETENELLKKDLTRKGEAESEIGSAEKELGPLRASLDGGRYGEEFRERMNALGAELEGLGYDGEEHGRIRETLRRLEPGAGEKELLERAKLSLGIRESEEKKLASRAEEEKQKLGKLEAEIRGLEGIENLAREIKEKMSAAGERTESLKKQKEGLLMDI